MRGIIHNSSYTVVACVFIINQQTAAPSLTSRFTSVEFWWKVLYNIDPFIMFLGINVRNVGPKCD